MTNNTTQANAPLPNLSQGERNNELATHPSLNPSQREGKSKVGGGVPAGWREVKLGEVVTFQRGFDLPKKNRKIGKYPLMVSNGQDGTHFEYKVEAPGVVTGRSGTLGKVFLVKRNFWPLNTTLWVKDFHGNDITFVYYFLKTLSLDRYNAGSGVPTLNRNHIHPLAVKIPPLPEQKAIAEVLSSLDDKIDILHRQNKTLEDIAESIFKKMFRQPSLNPSQREGNDEADEGWEEVKLGDFIQPKKGKNITRSSVVLGNVPVIAGGLEPSCYHNKANTEAPVITISASGANAGYVKLHHVPVWSSDSSFIDTTVTDYVYTWYVFLKLNQNILFDKQEGSAQPHIYPKHIMDIPLLKFPIEKIKQFEKNIVFYFQKILHNQSQIRTLENLRDTLLPKLMSGEVRVKF